MQSVQPPSKGTSSQPFAAASSGKVASSVKPQRKVVRCPTCGHEMAIPPEFEHVQGKCRVCGGVVNANGAATLLDDLAPPAVRPKPGAKKVIDAVTARHVILWGLIWGVTGAAIGGMISGTAVLVVGKVGQGFTLKAYFASAEMGMILGFVICSSWSIIKNLSLSILPGALVGCGISLTMGFLAYMGEWIFVATPDTSLPANLTFQVLAGIVAGGILGNFVGGGRED